MPTPYVLAGLLASAVLLAPAHRRAGARELPAPGAPAPHELLRAAQDALDRTDDARAWRLFTRALRADWHAPAPREGRARVWIQRRNPEAALGELVLIDTPTPETHRLRAEALLDAGRAQAARRAADRALRRAPGNGDVVGTAARAAYRTRDLRLARARYRDTVRIDPNHMWALVRIGEGLSRRSGPPTWPNAGSAAHFAHACRAWMRGALDDAEAGFRRLLAEDPDAVKAHMGLGWVLRERGWRRAYRFGGNCTGIYALLPTVAAPAIRHLVPGFERLTAQQQHALLVAVTPVAQRLPTLVAAGARHDVLALVDHLAAAPTRRHLADQATFDGRWYAHLRGVGGKHACTGEECLRFAACFGFNVFAHEFAHQVHAYATDVGTRDRIQTCYEEARIEGRCLDDYAASNVREYFAQGYEAWISQDKRRGLSKTAGHTRRELKRRDPALYALLSGMLSTAHETPEAMAAYEQAVAPHRLP